MAGYKLVPLPKGTISAKAKELKEFLNKRVKGQQRAIRYICEYFEVLWANLKDPKRPIAVFMFMGPSGVGKTETARALAEYLFGDPDAMTLFPCGNAQYGHEIYTLLGAPPSFVGHNNSAWLSHWNVYKHHTKHLCLTGEYFEIGIEKLSEQINKHEKTISEFREEISFWEGEISELSNMLEDCEKKLKELKWCYNNMDNAEVQEKIEDYKKRLEGYEAEISALKKNRTEKIKQHNEVFKEREALKSTLEEFKGIQAKPLEERFNLLTVWVEENKFFFDIGEKKAIILFDEIEKADSAIHNLLLQIMEEGRVTLNSPAGEVTDLRSCVVIMTSNLGAEDIAGFLNENHIGFKSKRRASSKEELEQKIYEISLEKLRESFTPEFIGRINKKVVFHPLDKDVMREILGQKVSESNDRNLFKLELDEEVKDLIVDETLKHPENGARLLNDRIDQFLLVDLAPMLTEKLIKAGDTVVVKLDKSAGEKNFQFLLKK